MAGRGDDRSRRRGLEKIASNMARLRASTQASAKRRVLGRDGGEDRSLQLEVHGEIKRATSVQGLGARGGGKNGGALEGSGGESQDWQREEIL